MSIAGTMLREPASFRRPGPTGGPDRESTAAVPGALKKTAEAGKAVLPVARESAAEVNRTMDAGKLSPGGGSD